MWYPQNPIYSQRQSPGFAQLCLKWFFLQIWSLTLLYSDSTLHCSLLRVYTTVGGSPTSWTPEHLQGWEGAQGSVGNIPTHIQPTNMNKPATGRWKWNNFCFLQTAGRSRSPKRNKLFTSHATLKETPDFRDCWVWKAQKMQHLLRNRTVFICLWEGSILLEDETKSRAKRLSYSFVVDVDLICQLLKHMISFKSE